jgi:hypothetical protein
MMMETTAEEYRRQASRCADLSDQAADMRRKILYRRMERGYLALAETQEKLDCPSVPQAEPDK